jgi:hypothetical protein
MINNSLNQKKLFKKKYFEIRDVGVFVEEKIFLKTKKFTINYENILPNKIETTISSKVKFWLMIILIVLSLFTLISESTIAEKEIKGALFYGVFAVIISISYIISREKVIVFKSIPEDIVLYADKPSLKHVNEFCDKLLESRKDYLRDLFTQSQTKTTNLERLLWLKEKNAITDEEYIKLKNEIIDKDSERDLFSSN